MYMYQSYVKVTLARAQCATYEIYFYLSRRLAWLVPSLLNLLAVYWLCHCCKEGDPYRLCTSKQPQMVALLFNAS